MRRALLLSAILLGVDQLSKLAASLAFAERPLLIGDRWGLTYVVNPGVYVWPDVPAPALYVLHGLSLAFWLIGLGAIRWYRRWYRSSALIDLAFACLTVGAFGNLIDRVLVGGARDWAVTPIATGNLADVAGWFAAALVLAELVAHRPSRRLLSIDPRRWHPSPKREVQG